MLQHPAVDTVCSKALEKPVKPLPAGGHWRCRRGMYLLLETPRETQPHLDEATSPRLPGRSPAAEGCSKRTCERSSPDCLVCKGEQQGQSRPGGARGGYYPRGACAPPYHRHTEEAEPRGQVCGLFISLREHDSQAHIIRQAFDPGGAGGRERGEPRGPPGSWRRTTNRLRTAAAKEDDREGPGIVTPHGQEITK